MALDSRAWKLPTLSLMRALCPQYHVVCVVGDDEIDCQLWLRALCVHLESFHSETGVPSQWARDSAGGCRYAAQLRPVCDVALRALATLTRY